MTDEDLIKYEKEIEDSDAEFEKHM